jgi:hypothetical protein
MCGFCNVWVCVCVGFVMCGCVYVWVWLGMCVGMEGCVEGWVRVWVVRGVREFGISGVSELT